MLLKNLLKNAKFAHENDYDFDEIEIKRISRDSKAVKKDDVFFSLSHDREKSLFRCREALQNGAKVVVSNFNFELENHLCVSDVRDVFAHACATFYNRACDDLIIVGITGTNGKTTISHVVGEMLKRNGESVGVIGTNGVYYDGKKFDCPLTTPDADFLHRTFFEMRESGVKYVIMEVSAHAIDQKRINGINFEIGLLTNITQDHLDYFETMGNYEKTKLSFFSPEHIKKAIVCCDDKSAIKLLENTKVPTVSYGLFSPSDVFAVDVCCDLNGSRFVANVCDHIMEIKTNLIGQYNVYNSLAALSVCQSLGLDDLQLVRGIYFINAIEGRFNVINLSGKYVVVDFAHSPDGLENVLKTAKDLTEGKIIVVFGCGGNRDKGKRSQMGEIAEKYADYVCLTDDNPRFEKSGDIIADIEKGMRKPHFVEPDRKKAVVKMLEFARPGDLILLAGKGAEKYQVVGDEKIPYSDFDVVYDYFQDKNPNNMKKDKEYYGC